MIQKEFAERAKNIVKKDPSIIGIAVAGSWLTDELDEFSDLDLIIVTKEKISGNKGAMMDYAEQFGNLLNAFTGEHVGEPRLLICLYDDPLLHVDLKFVTLEEFSSRVEDPFVLHDTDNKLQKAIDASPGNFPIPDYQWIEDRFWTWVHYALLKIGRGEYFEALDFFGYLRMVVFGPLLHIKNGNLPRGVRKVETKIARADFETLLLTVGKPDKESLIRALENSITLYRNLRTALFHDSIIKNDKAEAKVIEYLQYIKGL